jgi:hypothetical protein
MLRLYQTPSYELWWQPDDGTFCLQTPGRKIIAVPGVEYINRGKPRHLSGAGLESGRISQESFYDVHGHGQSIQIHYLAASGLALSLRIRLYQTRPFVLMRISVTNVGSDTAVIRRFFLRSMPGGIQTTAEPRGFFTNGWYAHSPAGYLDRTSETYSTNYPYFSEYTPSFTFSRDLRFGRKGLFISELVGAVITQNEALVGGCISAADQFVHYLADISADFNLFELQSLADDIPLDVGASLSSEWLYLEWVPLPNVDPFAQYAFAIKRHMNLNSPAVVPLGWRSRDDEVQDLSEAGFFDVIAGLALFNRELPVKRIEVCSGYQSEAGDWSRRNEDKFPHDSGWIAKRIVGSGMIPEITLSPLIVFPHSAISQNHSDWLLRTDRNAHFTMNLPMGAVRCLDVTHPAAYAYLTRIIGEIVNQWGYKGIRLAHMYIGSVNGQRYNQRMTRAQALYRAYRCIREAAGSDIFITANQSPYGPAIGLVDSMAVSESSELTWQTETKSTWTRKTSDRELSCIRNSLLNTLNRAWMNGRLWINESGTLTLDQQISTLTMEELLTQITIFGLSGSAVTLSDNLASVKPEIQELLAVLFPPLLEGLDVVDQFDATLPEVAVVNVGRSWGHWQLVALFNWSDEFVERDLPASLNLDIQTAYHLVDFWEQRYFLMKSDSAWPVLHLDPHGVVLLSLRPVVTETAHLVATTFHISQGGEIIDFITENCHASVNMDIGRTARGSVWLALPEKPHQLYLNGKPLDLSSVRTVASGVFSISFVVHNTAELLVSWCEDKFNGA